MTGAELKEARRKLGLSQQALADELGMSRNMVGFMERGYGEGGKPVGISQTTAMAVWCLLYEAEAAEIGDRAT